jgi:hypothetical protein
MNEVFRLLVINPGSTSTKIAIFDNEKPVFEEVIRHTSEELAPYPTIFSQYQFRKEIILETLNKKDINLTKLSAVVGRGGLLHPIPSGTYEVNDKMIEDLRLGLFGQHASSLGGVLAREIASQLNIPSYIVDPVVVDELEDVARISGVPEIERISIFHALNQKAVARRAARDLGKPYEELNLIVNHIGGGISVGAHKKGRVVDVNNALNGYLNGTGVNRNPGDAIVIGIHRFNRQHFPKVGRRPRQFHNRRQHPYASKHAFGTVYQYLSRCNHRRQGSITLHGFPFGSQRNRYLYAGYLLHVHLDGLRIEIHQFDIGGQSPYFHRHVINAPLGVSPKVGLG